MAKRVFSEEERKAFGERMKKAREKKGVCQPKPTGKIPEEVKELSGISETGNVNVFIKNPININGISYAGMCNVPRSLAQSLQYHSDMVDERIRKEHESPDHGFQEIGRLNG